MADRFRTQEEFNEYFTQPESAITNLGPEERNPVTVDELVQMAIDISLGAVEPPKEFDVAHREAWAELKLEIAEIHEAGGSLELPHEIP